MIDTLKRERTSMNGPNGDIPAKLYFKISEACEIVGLPAHVLRFWEKQFQQLNPDKTQSGHRIYRKSDLLMALKIKELLYEQKFTIKGAKELINATGVRSHAAAPEDERRRLIHLKKGLLKLRAKLDKPVISDSGL